MRRESRNHLPAPILFRSSFVLAGLAICIATTGLAAPLALSAQTAVNPPAGKGVIQVMDRATLQQHFRALGYKAHGEIGQEIAASDNPLFRAFPHFSSSFSVNGVTYPYRCWAFRRNRGAAQVCDR